jgi:hypothetical protein
VVPAGTSALLGKGVRGIAHSKQINDQKSTAESKRTYRMLVDLGFGIFIFPFSIFCFCFCKVILENMVVRYRGTTNKGVLG